MLAAREILGSTPAIEKGASTWKTVRDLPGIDPHLLPPEPSPGPNFLGEFATAVTLGFSTADAPTRRALLGFGIWVGASAIGVLAGWLLRHSVYFAVPESVALVSTGLFGTLSLALLRRTPGAHWMGIAGAAVALLALGFQGSLFDSLLGGKPIGLIYAIGEIGLVVAFASLVLNPHPRK